MKFKIFGYEVTILKMKTIEQETFSILQEKGRVPAIKFYREQMLRIGGDTSLKHAIEVVKAMQDWSVKCLN